MIKRIKHFGNFEHSNALSNECLLFEIEVNLVVKLQYEHFYFSNTENSVIALPAAGRFTSVTAGLSIIW